jgi:hypothetical protein
MAEDLQYPSVSCDFTENAPHISSLIGVFFTTQKICGTRGSVVVKALCCKPEGRGFKSR